ncbi:MAG: hypothetical protein C4K58_04165 [Flavobacteriaceae bacterium]|nr:MAG: hypothetical protein C4K58_04165 [Flavobacteriaceae bacterium]
MKFESYKVTPGANIDLDKWSTLPTREESEVDFEEEIQKNIEKMDDLQKALYGESKQSLLVIFQGIDAAGKDSTIRAVFSGINPAGISVTSFKKPSQEELSHDYLWRHVKALPRRGEIAIFNRSHYENVLITKVHPELILFENLPGIESVSDIGEDL